MYKLIIVDDEYTIRRGLQQYIPWYALGFEVSGVFEDGFSAMNYLSNHSVDVVLTDINMPVMNGIKLIQLIREKDYPMRCVVISGYNDFNYAKQLIPYQLTDYLLKPINNDEISTLFTSIKRSLDAESIALRDMENERKQVAAMKHTLKQQLFSDIFLNQVPLASTYDYLERYGLDNDILDNYILYTKLHIDNTEALLQDSWHYGIDALYDSIVNYLKNLTTDFSLTDFPSGQDDIHVIGLSSKNNTLEDCMTSYKEMLHSAILWIESISNIKISITTLHSYDSIEKIEPTYNHITATIEAKPQTKFTHTETTMESSSGTDLTYFYSAINSAFLERNLEQVYERLDTLYEMIKQYLSDDARKIYQSILDILFRQFDDIETISIYYSEKLISCNNIHDMTIYTKQCIEQLAKQLSEDSDNQLERLMKQALIYIEEHYQQDISRNDVADYVFLSSSYFSRCFKRVVGVKFIDHLTKLRIQKACELLMDCNNKISDVCENVGYNSPSYFTRVFKCTMGITPNEYIRANILK